MCRMISQRKSNKSLQGGMTLVGLFFIFLGLNVFANLDPKELAVIFRDF
jgi:hypothetical protein